MDKLFGYFVFGGLLIGALMGIAIGAIVGASIGWFAGAAYIEQKKQK